MAKLSDVLKREWLQKRERFLASVRHDMAEWFRSYCEHHPEFAAQVALVWSCSDFVFNYALRCSQSFRELVVGGDFTNPRPPGHYRQQYADKLDTLDSEDALIALLRQVRNRELARIVWRDFCGLADLVETTEDMTSLAEASLDAALDYLYPRACERYGVPHGAVSGKPQRLVVLGMGKLGARELNVSSDIDLIFAYPEAGETKRTNASGNGQTCSNQEFFERLGRKLIQALDRHTVDGIAFRVDMRLRPYGASAPLAGSFDAMETYYQTQGRGWERFAMVKARPVAGDLQAGKTLLTMLRPFTYRKYIDFSSIESLREIKALIEHEVHRTGAGDDVKRGPGGIREVEFIAQAFQLVRGGRDPRLQQPSLRKVLPLLEQEQLLPSGKAAALIAAYDFLRDIEHAVQGFNDSQTHRLPNDDPGRARLVQLFGCDDWQQLEQQLRTHRRLVQQVFSSVIAQPEQSASVEDKVLQAGAQVWQAVQRDQPVAEQLAGLGFDQPEASAQQLQDLAASHPVQLMQADARQRLAKLLPMLLAACGAQREPSLVLARTLTLVESVARRSAYLLLLVENPGALQQLITLCAASPWIAHQIATYPALLDELLDPRTLYRPRDKAALADELHQQLLRIPEQDLEAQLEVLRYFKHSNSLRVAACEVTDVLPLMKVSDNLTWVAEVLLDCVLTLAWDQMTARYGEPGGSDPGVSRSGFLIVGYGKLGGIEMGHSSDLDLVFLYDADPAVYTNGEHAVDNATFFLRLGQRIIHLLTTQTVTGVLYDVDMRLRPSGNSGMLVSSLAAFAKYQRDSAWTWEHQALVRARPIAGDPQLADRMAQIRQEVLVQPRQINTLKTEVCNMRRKMAEHLSEDSQSNGESFDLKQGSGGIVDIEFMVQFAVLAWAAEHPELTLWSDNIRVLETLATTGKLPLAEVEQLIAAYKDYRSAGHRAQLQQQPSHVPAECFKRQRAQVMAVWRKVLETDD